MPKSVEKHEYICYQCSKKYLVYPSRVKSDLERGYKFHFCSRACKSTWNKSVAGHWKGKSIPFYKRPNRNVKGSLNGRWKGGRRIDKSGYVLILRPEHPQSDFHGYVREHRLVIEQKIGRYLKAGEVVHHVNNNKQDNRPENLILIGSTSEHQKLHYHNGDSKHLKNYTP